MQEKKERLLEDIFQSQGGVFTLSTSLDKEGVNFEKGSVLLPLSSSFLVL